MRNIFIGLSYKLKPLIVACIIACLEQSVAEIRPSSTIHTNESFFAYLEPLGDVKECWFRFDVIDSTHFKPRKLDLNVTVAVEAENGVSVLPFSKTVCGVRGNITSKYLSSKLFLTAEYTNGSPVFGEAIIHKRKPPRYNAVTKITSDSGEKTISCTHFKNFKRRCTIVLDTGERWDRCELTTTIRANRTFMCYVYKWGDSAEGTEEIIVTVNKPLAASIGSIEETPTSLILRCQFYTGKIKACYVQQPFARSELYIRESQCRGRYSAYDTNVAASKCAIEILKPLKENEIGLWRIVNYESETPEGCLFYVGKNKTDVIEKELKDIKNAEIQAVQDDDIISLPTLTYMLPFQLKYCYMIAPNREVHFPEQNFETARSYGNCSFTNLPIVGGTWVFGALGVDYDKEVIRDVQVHVKPRVGTVLTPTATVKTGESVKLMCRSSFDEPISYCSFMDPTRRVYVLGTPYSKESVGHATYYGRGLEHGDCGVVITKVQHDEFGTWQCQFGLVSNNKSSKFEIQLIQALQI